MLRLALPLVLGLSCPAVAQIDALFSEDTPKDIFTLTNTGCSIRGVSVVLDMTGSYGSLIFDTEGSAEGSDAPQPFEAVSGAMRDVSVEDDTSVLRLTVPDWPKDGEVSFTLDVDDVLRHGELGRTKISGREIAGTEIRINTPDASGFGVFDNTRRATVRNLCPP